MFAAQWQTDQQQFSAKGATAVNAGKAPCGPMLPDKIAWWYIEKPFL